MKYKTLRVNSFAENLLKWYVSGKRVLPWRETRDPYSIWVSEIILQQTRVNQGLPYYKKFLERYPNVKSLANASETSVLKTWEGLGYYSRARNMHNCAKIIVNQYEGIFPTQFEELLKLPGIGRYTAAAIASFAFKQNVPAIDGNVSRVISRVFRFGGKPGSVSTNNKLWELSKKLIPKSSPDLYNQAMMDLGSTICKPSNPVCNACPVALECEAFQNKEVDKFPPKKARIKVRKRYFNYVILKSGEKTYFQLRKDNDIWQGLYEFMLVESTKPLNIEEVLEKVPSNFLKEPEVLYESREVKHKLSHQEIRAKFVEVSTLEKKVSIPGKGKMFGNEEISSLPTSVLIRNYLQEQKI